jgi:hypothetical protein
MERNAKPLRAALQGAYLMHLAQRGHKRLPWLEAAIDRTMEEAIGSPVKARPGRPEDRHNRMEDKDP